MVVNAEELVQGPRQLMLDGFVGGPVRAWEGQPQGVHENEPFQ